MSQPKSEVRRKGQRVEHALVTLRGAHFDYAPGSGGEIREILLREEDRRRLGAAPGCKGHENRPKLGLNFLFDRFTAMKKSAGDCPRPASQSVFVGNKD